MALELVAAPGRSEGWRQYLGTYKLESREVNGKPAWRHSEQHNLWLVFDGVGWAAQPEERLGDRFGWMQLRDTIMPHASKGVWQVAPDGATQWVNKSDVECRLANMPRYRSDQYDSDTRGEYTPYGAPEPRCQRRPEPSYAGSSASPPSRPEPGAGYVQRARDEGPPAASSSCDQPAPGRRAPGARTTRDTPIALRPARAATTRPQPTASVAPLQARAQPVLRAKGEGASAVGHRVRRGRTIAQGGDAVRDGTRANARTAGSSGWTVDATCPDSGDAWRVFAWAVVSHAVEFSP
jgi:hypothetical protein